MTGWVPEQLRAIKQLLFAKPLQPDLTLLEVQLADWSTVPELQPVEKRAARARSVTPQFSA